MARLARRTLLLLLTTLIEGAVLIKKSPPVAQNATVANVTVSNSTAAAAGKVEVIDAKDSITNSLVGKDRKQKSQDSLKAEKDSDSASMTMDEYREEKAEEEADKRQEMAEKAELEAEDQAEEEAEEKAQEKPDWWHRRRRRAAGAKDAIVKQVAKSGGDEGENKYYFPKGCQKVKYPSLGVTAEDRKDALTYRSSKMTHDMCYYHCVEVKSLFMSLYEGDKCMCFSRYEYLYEPGPGEKCDRPCGGAKQTDCGGNKASNVYALEIWVPKLPTKDCGKPDAVPHIQEMCENGGEDHGLTCDVKCNKGYRVAENSLMCDTAAGMWFGFVHCAPYLCLPPAPPIAFASKTCAGGAVDGVKHGHFQTDCPITCLPGYDLKENTLKCVEPENKKEPSGVLKGSALCQPKVCGVPKAVEHANYPVGIQAYPTMVQYTCQNGYTLDGTLTGITYSHVQCKADGKFDEVKFKCLPLVCGMAPPIANAQLSIMPPGSDDGVAFPAAPVYKCKVGFSMDGTGTGERLITVPCQATGAFPDPLPACKPVKCGGPPGIAFSHIMESDAVKGNVGVDKLEVVPLGYQQTAVLKCNSGYSFKPKEDPKRENMEFMVNCEDNGLFENVQVCAPVNCGKPPDASYTVKPDLDVHFPLHVEYSCLDGYSLTGKADAHRGFTIECMANRRFSDLPPTKGCLPLECGRPHRVEHAKLVRGAPGEVVKFPSTLQYKCDEGFSTDRTKSSGAAVFSVGCESTGSFSDWWECLAIDDCIGHTCGPMGDCEDLHMDYRCNCARGFEAVFNEDTQEKECGNINDCGPEACGAGTCEDLVEGYKCHCPTGYEVTAPAEAPKNFTCSRVVCGNAPIVQNADRPGVKAAFEDAVPYVCHVGYTLDGSPAGHNMFHTNCLADKSFTPVPDLCKPVKCGRAPRKKFSRVDKRGVITFTQSITYTCASGYSTDGSLLEATKSFSATCLETGDFTELMDCVPIICGSPKSLSFSSVEATILTFRQKAHYACLEGYSTDGSTDAKKKSFSARCQADGGFAREAPGCRPVTCGSAPLVKDAVAESAEGDVVFPMLSAFMCHEGFSLNGKIDGERTFSTKCEANGKFSGVKKCHNVECGEVPKPPFTEIIQGGDIPMGVFGDIFKYKCQKGYGLEALPTDLEIIQPGGEKQFAVACQANGQYSVISTCKNIDDCAGHTCGPHGTCVDGIAKFSCDCEEGFEAVEVNGDPFCGNVDDCGNHKCGSHGTCVDEISGYTCSCSMGYHIEKEGEDTMCKPNSCGDMPVIEAAEHGNDASELVFPMIVTYECKEGYSIDQTIATEAKTFEVQCDANGDAQNIQKCLKVTCPPPGGILNLKKGPDLTKLAEFKDKLEYECNDGFTTSGEADGPTKFDLECGPDGLFKPEIFPVCSPVSCGKPPDVKKANYPSAIMHYPAVVSYACDLGYSMDATAAEDKAGFSIKCQTDGKFEDIPVPDKKCKRIKCGTFPEVANAKYDKGEKGEFDDAEEYKCKSGFSTDGSVQGQTSWSVTCQANGQFSESFECVPITFTVLGKMKNAVNNAPVPGGKAVLTYKDHDEGDAGKEGPGNSIGEFALHGIKQGKAIIKYSAPGYINADIKLDVQGNIQSGTTADVAMSPEMGKDEWRAVLSWGDKPRDMDTHLYWKNRRACHVYYARRRVDCPDKIKGILDVDDVSSFGPETLTFKNVGKTYNSFVNGLGPSKAPILQYKIKNYSRRPTLDSRDDVVVKLYNGKRMVKEFKIGRDGRVDGRWWHVFELNGYTGELTGNTG